MADTTILRERLTVALVGVKWALADLQALYGRGDEDVGRYMKLKTAYETRRAEIEMLLGKTEWDAANTQHAHELIAALLQTLPDMRGAMNWEAAAQRYAERVKDRYCQVHIIGMARAVSVAGIFTSVYLLDKPTAFRRYDITQLREDPRRLVAEHERQDALSIATQREKLFILGKPGAGKTTFLKYVAWLAVQGQIAKTPIFVGLKEWVDSGQELMDFLVHEFAVCHFPHAQVFIEHLLAAGQAIVLFDGLDEVSREHQQRAKLIKTITDFVDKYPDNRYLLTCRIAANEYVFRGFDYVEIADFMPEQVKVFVSKWFGDNAVKRESFLEDFARDEHRGLREMASSPLLLTLLCLTFDALMRFPPNRDELYEQALDTLLRKWDASRNIRRDEIYRELSLKRKRQMFAQIAAETFEAGDYFLRQSDLANRIEAYLQRLSPVETSADVDGEAVLKAIEAQHGIFVERAHRVYSFAHLTFQEYFTAQYIVDNAVYGTLEGLIRSHLTDDRWREVFLLTASMLPNADNFFALFREAIDELIRADTELLKLLRWAAEKARDYIIAGREEHYSTRACACSLALGRALAREIIFSKNFARAFVCSIPRPPLHGAYHNRARARIRDGACLKARNLAQAHTCFFALDYALAHTLARTCTLNLDRYQYEAFSHAIGYIGTSYRALAEALELSQELGLSPLHQALANLKFPAEDAPKTEWETFAAKLQKVMIEHRNIGHDWSLTDEQWEWLEQYLAANQFLLDCLEVAYVSDRDAIKDSLLLPPESERRE